MKKTTLHSIALAALIAAVASGVNASSHREAPMISIDPTVDATDLFAFVSPDRSDTVTLIANYIPFEEPAGGPNFFRFDDNAKYVIHIDNNGDAKEDISYEFRFKTSTKNGNTFLYNTGAVNSLSDATLNVTQTYTITKVEGGVSTEIAKDVPTAPNYVGAKSMPNYMNLHKEAIRNLGNEGTAFAGQVDDPFFVELGGLFNLLTIRKLPGNTGAGVDGLNGYNTHAIALQVPISKLTKTKTRITDSANGDAVIGVWTSAYRQANRVLSPASSVESGNWIQVSRLGAPLVNEVVVPLAAKDLWNASQPKDDAQFANGVTNPELTTLLNALYGIKVPPQGNFGTPQARNDLVTIFLTGIKGLTQPNNVVPSEQLRLNTAIAPSAKENSLGVAGGDTAGYPNGRRLADDVTDISIKAVAGALYSTLQDKNFVADPLAGKLGDGVDKNDKDFQSTFPYLALPSNGYDSQAHGGRYLSILLEILKLPLEKLISVLSK